MNRGKDGAKEMLSVKVLFNPDLPLDAEILKVLRRQPNKTAYIKFVLYQHISTGYKSMVSNDKMENVQALPGLPEKNKSVHQWDRDAAFADAFEPLK